MDSRVLKQVNRDASTERDTAKLKCPVNGKSRNNAAQHGLTIQNTTPTSDRQRNSWDKGPAASSVALEEVKGKAVAVVPAGLLDSAKIAVAEPEQHSMEEAVGPQGTVREAAGPVPAAPAAQTAGSRSLQAAAAARLAGAREQPEQSPHQAEQQQGQQAVDVRPLRASADTSAAEEPADEIDDISDSDFEQPQSKTAAAGRKQKAPARAVQRRGKASRGTSPDEPVGAKGGSSSDLSADEISGSDDDDAVDGDDKQPQPRRSTRPQRQQQQQQQQRQPATGRPRRAAAVKETPVQDQEQQQGVRRSTRPRRAARGSPDDSPEEAPAARPRRAAAAAAKEATAAALAAEAAPATWATNLVDDSDLGSPDTSDAEEAGGDTPNSNTPSGDDSDSEGSLVGEGAGDDVDSWGPEGGSRQRQRRQQQPTRQQPKRGRGVRAAVVDDSSEDSDSQADDDQGPPAAADDSGDDDGGDQPLDLNAFRYNAQQHKAAAAAAGGRRGQAKRHGSGGSSGGSSDGEEDGAAAVAAALQAESELLRDVCDVSEFTPQELQKLPCGSDVDKLLTARYEDDGGVKVLAKLVGRPYRAAVWLPAAVVEAKRAALLRNFLGRHAGGEVDNDWADNNNINPLWYKVDRVVSDYKSGREAPQYLVKWCGLEYSDSTWEQEEELCRDGAGKVALARYKRWSAPPRSRPTLSKRPRQELLDEKLLPDFKNGRKLRDYQEESLHWMINNYRGQIVHGRWKPRNCILGDEMGLGKTAQSIAVMSWLKQYAGASAPCMVVAPLTTLGHWKREIETWTYLNVVLYAGSAEDRRLIREYEFFYPKHRTYGPRFNVLLSSYETVLKDKTELKKLQFEALIVDEAHRLKNSKSATRLALQELSVRWLLMLSGTPVQNNMKELQGLMSLLDKDLYGDVEDFLEQYGSDTPNLEQIRALQAALAPVLLRRMKEDVEDLPEKEEVVIWVELTQEQRRYYRALYSQQIGALLGGGSNKNLPGMRNLAMELRKLCCHPFLCDGLEDDMTLKWAADHAAGKTPQERDIENYTRASGKMLLLHKLLPKLKAEGRQVLVFSQFKMMLDVIEDYLTACGHRFERIDGDTKQSERQAAIDRFMAVKDRQRSKTPGGSSKTPASSPGTSPTPEGNTPPDAAGTAAAAAAGKPGAGSSREPSPAAAAAAGGDEDDGGAADGPFVFLLSTRAGGQGITLTSADTVIIYDSDWNPQNDLQAMARCHRIGQDKEVTVYRLVSKNTYEQQLFECASRKYGLDEAILGFAGAGDNPENDAARIEQLLRLGAHAILQGAGEGAACGAGGGVEAAGEDKGFAAEDIEQILLGRSEKRQLGSRKGNTFSIAHFGDGGGELEPEQEEVEAAAPKDAKTFWTELLPEAVADHAAALATKKEPVLLGPRRRRQVDYREANMGARGDDASSSDFTAGGDDEGDDEGDAQGPARGGAKGTKRPADAEADPQGSGGKKHKKKAEDNTHDPELGRPVQPWKAVQVEVVRDALLRYGVDRMDKVVALCQAQGLLLRQSDEISQLSSALVLTLGEMLRLAPALHQQEKAAKEAAMAAAAAGQPGSNNAGKNASLQYVNGLRDGLVQAGLEGKLPKSCSKALLSLDAVRRMGRAPGGLQQQLDDHHKVHLAMVAAGLGHSSSKGSPTAAAAAGSGATSSAQQQEAATTPVKPQPAAAAAAAAGDGDAATPGVDGSKRVWVAPRVLLRGSKGLPLWWKRDHDDQLLQGSYHHGFLSSSKLTAIVEAILQDPAHGFTGKVGLDPVEVVKEQAALAAPPPPLTAPTPPAAAADGSTPAVVPVPAPQPPPPGPVDPEKMAAAQRVKQQLQQEHADIELLRPVDWRKLVAALVQRLKRVRTALLDPNYVEPPTPNKPIVFTRPLNLSTTPAAAGAGGGAAAAAGSAQQRLHLTPASDGGVLYKGKKVIGGGLPVGTAAAGGPGRTPPGGQGPMPVVLSPVQQQQLLLQHQRMVAQHNAATAYNAARTVAALAAVNAAQIAQLQVKKRQAQEQLNSGVNKKPTGSNDPSPVANHQQPAPPQRLAAMAAAAAAAESRQKQLQQQRMLLQQQQARQQPQQQPEVVELLDDDTSDDDLPAPPPARSKPSMSTPAAAGAGAVGAPAQPPPSSGMMVRRMPAGADLSQEQSLDEPTGAEAAGETPAGTVSSSGKQHMQQLLGSTKADGSAEGGAAASKAADHPVYGTPAGAAATAAVGTKRKQDKDDTKQRKLNEFFAVSK